MKTDSEWAALRIRSDTRLLVGRYELLKRESGQGQHRKPSVAGKETQNSSYVCMA